MHNWYKNFAENPDKNVYLLNIIELQFTYELILTIIKSQLNKFLFLARLYKVQEASLCRHLCGVGGHRRPMLTFAFRSNVDKLLGPG